MENLFPNSQWQLWTSLGPAWDGGASIPITDHLASFETEWNWLNSGNLPAVAVNYVTSRAVNASDTSFLPGLADTGQMLVEVVGDAAVQYMYPGALIVFSGAVHPRLQLSAFRVRRVNYTTKTFTFLAARNQAPPSGAINAGCRQIMRCDRAGVTGNGPDGWVKNVDAFIWPDRWPRVPMVSTPTMIFAAGANEPDRPAWSCKQRASAKRSVVFQPQSNADAYFFYRVPDFRMFCGRTISFGMWVKRTGGPISAVGRLGVNDGQINKSAMTASSPDWSWLEMTHRVADDPPTQLDIGFLAEGSNQTRWQVSEPMMIFGSTIGLGQYSFSRGLIDKLAVKITPDSYYGADFSFGNVGSGGSDYGHVFDPFAETAGALSEDLRGLFVNVDFTTNVAGRVISLRNRCAPPHIYGPVNRSSIAGQVTFAAGLVETEADGTCWMSTDVQSAPFTDVSIDVDQVILR